MIDFTDYDDVLPELTEMAEWRHAADAHLKNFTELSNLATRMSRAHNFDPLWTELIFRIGTMYGAYSFLDVKAS